MKVRGLVSFIAFGVMMALAVTYFGALGVRIGPPENRTNLSIKVADINGLFVDSNVLLRGVPVGKITNLSTSVDGATVDFYIDGRYRVPADSDVKFGNLSALGEAYIQLVPRVESGPTFQDGQRIPTELVTQPPYVSDLAASVGRVLNQLDPGALERITDELDTAIPPPDAVLPNLVRTSKLLKNLAANMNGHGSALLGNFQTLLQNASWVGPILADLAPYPTQIGHALGGLMSVIAVNVYHGAPMTVVAMRRLLDRIQKLLDTNGSDLKVLGERFLPHVKGIAGALLNFDPSQIMANILATLPEDGVVTLHVIPN
ncbi:MAG: MlaD family protein [Mycobacterium sp.]|uniref:MlaD family protein n=1 Tax=Mycobacterium sp. TaxID=1785 RepID=UPI003C53F32F